MCPGGPRGWRRLSAKEERENQPWLPWWHRGEKTHLPIQEMHVRSSGGESPLEEEMATHSCVLAWRIPWTEEPGELQSTGSQEWDTTVAEHTRTSTQNTNHLARRLQTPSRRPSVFSPGVSRFSKPATQPSELETRGQDSAGGKSALPPSDPDGPLRTRIRALLSAHQLSLHRGLTELLLEVDFFGQLMSVCPYIFLF